MPRIVLDLELDDRPFEHDDRLRVVGTFACQGTSVDFDGWLELLALLESSVVKQEVDQT